MIALIVVVSLLVYLLPSIAANLRKHNKEASGKSLAFFWRIPL